MRCHDVHYVCVAVAVYFGDLPISSDIDSIWAKKEKQISVQRLREIIFVFYTDFPVGTAVTRLILQSDYGLEDREVGVPLLVQITRYEYVASPQHSHWL